VSGEPRFLWYVPNTVEPGHRGDDTVDGWGSLRYSVELARSAERHGWGGALIGTGWGRPDTFTVATPSPRAPRRSDRWWRSAGSGTRTP
jgi:alkanesulfonate monooxygenase SsuD/methylene tetrahydromethanopterin reductase-like flavin-dependent oxidoreductase (luciferase family)